MLDALTVLITVELIGVAALPITMATFRSLPISPWGLSKPLGLVLLGWFVWVVPAIGIAPYGTTWIAAAFAFLAVGSWTWWIVSNRQERRLLTLIEDRTAIYAEAIFIGTFAIATLLVSSSPDVWSNPGEKPMDMMIINAVNASTQFPPHDAWLAGSSLNYYYLGHFLSALVIRISNVRPDIGYNVMLSVIYAFSATTIFVLGSTLAVLGRRVQALTMHPAAVGLTTVAIAIWLGNPVGVVQLLSGQPFSDKFDWFQTTRVITDTINEFPLFSFLLGDLHAHFQILPITVLALTAFVLLMIDRRAPPRRLALIIVIGSLLVGFHYAANAWSYPILLAVLFLMAVVADSDRLGHPRAVISAVILTGLSVIVILPYLFEFDPAVHGLGWVSGREELLAFLGHNFQIFGVFFWILATAFWWRARATKNPVRNIIWLTIATLFVALLIANGRVATVVITGVLFGIALQSAMWERSAMVVRLVWVFIAVGFGCLLVPEIFFIRDELMATQYYRLNTVFRFGYVGWLLFAIAAGNVLFWEKPWRIPISRHVWHAGIVVLICGSLIYPIIGTYSRHAAFSRTQSLSGLNWLQRSAPGDVAGIDWLRANTPIDAVVLEAVGDDYSLYGHARFATFSGRSNVVGWEGHERMWNHRPGDRRREVEIAYKTTNLLLARRIIDRYRVDYVIVGPLEKADYGYAGIGKWDRLGRVVFREGQTTIWQTNRKV